MTLLVENTDRLLEESDDQAYRLKIARNLLSSALRDMPREYTASSWLLKFKKLPNATLVSGPPESIRALLRNELFGGDDIEWEWSHKAFSKARTSRDAKVISILVTGLIGELG